MWKMEEGILEFVQGDTMQAIVLNLKWELHSRLLDLENSTSSQELPEGEEQKEEEKCSQELMKESYPNNFNCFQLCIPRICLRK